MLHFLVQINNCPHFSIENYKYANKWSYRPTYWLCSNILSFHKTMYFHKWPLVGNGHPSTARSELRTGRKRIYIRKVNSEKRNFDCIHLSLKGQTHQVISSFWTTTMKESKLCHSFSLQIRCIFEIKSNVLENVVQTEITF